MKQSYEFSIGSVRVREKKLLGSADFEQLIACENVNQLCRYLTDKGYGDGEAVDELITSHMNDVWSYLKSTAPDDDVFAPFMLQNDLHNIKTVLKGTLTGREYTELLVKPCTIDISLIKKAVEERKFSSLPEWISASCKEAYDALAHNSDARLSDALLDKACMQRMLEVADECDSEFIKAYFNTIVFYSDIKLAVRSSRTGTDSEFLKTAMAEVDGLDKSSVISNAVKGADSLVSYLEKVKSYGCDMAMAEYKKSPSGFEKFIDNRLVMLAKEFCKRASEGAEPLIGYLLASEYEKKAIHIIASGIRTNSDRDVVRERLREFYV